MNDVLRDKLNLYKTSLIASSLADILPPQVVSEVCMITDSDHSLFPEEAEVIRRSATKRRKEFSAGRIAAHRAMSLMRLDNRPILAHSDRTPIWPPGVVGSISHTRHIAIAALARREHMQSVGIDLEEAKVLSEEIVERVCVPLEITHLDEWSTKIGIDAAKLIFSAKEAFYKCYYPIEKQFLDFLDVSIHLHPSSSSFEITMREQETSDLSGYAGRFGCAQGHVFAAVVIPVRPPVR